MKKQFIIFILVVLYSALPLSSQAQIVNAGFELWTADQPNDWYTPNVPGIISPITKSTTKHSGSYALKGEILSYFDSPYPASIIAGSTGLGFPVSERHASLKGYYQFSPVSGDQFNVLVLMSKDDLVVGGGEFLTAAGASSYTEFTLNIEYYLEEVPNLCDILILIVGPVGEDYHIGTVMLVDDLSFSGVNTLVQGNVAQLQIPDRFSLSQNYPNPFNPSCVIEYAVPEISEVSIRVYDVMGREVQMLFQGVNVPGIQKVVFQADGLPGGLYFFRMTAKSLKSGEMFMDMKKAVYSK